MTQVLDAIYEHGTFRPLAPPDLGLVEGQKVRIRLERGDTAGSNASPEEYDLDALLAMPRNERASALRQAAEAAADEYARDLARPAHERELTAMTALDGEAFTDEPA